MTVKSAAERLEVSPSTIYALVSSGRLKCVRIGVGRGAIRISEEHVAEFLKGAEPEKKAAPPTTARPGFRHLKLS